MTIQYMTLYIKKMKYWNEQGRFPADQNDNTNWDVVKHARANIPFNRKYG